MRVRAACEHPDHIGDRLVDRRDLTELRLEWRGLVDQRREQVRIVRRECMVCVRRGSDRAGPQLLIDLGAPA